MTTKCRILDWLLKKEKRMEERRGERKEGRKRERKRFGGKFGEIQTKASLWILGQC